MNAQQLHHLNVLFHLAVAAGFLFGMLVAWLVFHFWVAAPHYKAIADERTKFAKESAMLKQIREAWKRNLALAASEDAATKPEDKDTVRCQVQGAHDTIRVQ
jgi:hypothetical protein